FRRSRCPDLGRCPLRRSGFLNLVMGMVCRARVIWRCARWHPVPVLYVLLVLELCEFTIDAFVVPEPVSDGEKFLQIFAQLLPRVARREGDLAEEAVVVGQRPAARPVFH